MFAGSNSSTFPQQNEPIVFSTLASTLNPDPSFIASTSALNALSAHNMLHSFNLGASNKITTSQIPTNQQTYFDPMLYNLALQQPQCSTNPFDLEKFNLLRAFLQNQQSTSQTTHSIATTNSQQSTSALLAEQQARESEIHRLQLFGLQALNPIAGTSQMPDCHHLDQFKAINEICHQNNMLIDKTVNANEMSNGTPNEVFDSTNAEETIHVNGIIPQLPYYPSHFFRGTVLQTSSDSKKVVECLNKEDFNNLSTIASQAHEMQMSIGKVLDLKLDESTNRQVTVVFETETQLENGDIEISTCELTTPIEYPFFEISKNFASYNPIKSLNLYGLECSQLKIGDKCLVLTAFQQQSQSSSIRRLSPIPETNRSDDSQCSSSNNRVSYFCSSDVEMDDHVQI